MEEQNRYYELLKKLKEMLTWLGTKIIGLKIRESDFKDFKFIIIKSTL
jgi:hypothetical protein